MQKYLITIIIDGKITNIAHGGMDVNVIKIMNGTPFNLMGFEIWLNNMAANQGLILVAIRGPWCIFIKQEPRDIEYKLEPGLNIHGKKLKEKYSNMGWRYVCRWKGIYVFCAPRQYDSYEEKHINPQEYVSMIKRGRGAVFFDILKWAALLTIILFALKERIGRNNTPG